MKRNDYGNSRDNFRKYYLQDKKIDERLKPA